LYFVEKGNPSKKLEASLKNRKNKIILKEGGRQKRKTRILK
jgi:hypothetical protein